MRPYVLRNKYFKYGLIFITMTAGIALQVFLAKSGLPHEVAIGIVPGLILGVLMEIVDLRFSIDETNRVLKIVDVVEYVGRGKYQTKQYYEKLSEALRKIDSFNHDLYSEYAAELLRRAIDDFCKSSHGTLHLSHSGDLLDTPIRLMTTVEKTMDTVLLWREDTLTGNLGKRYIDEMTTAITKRNVKIRRLFILPDDPSDEIDAIAARMEKDKAINIEVRFMFESEWTYEGGPVDFGIWDEDKVWLFTRMDDKGGRKASIIFDKNEIDRYQSTIFNPQWNGNAYVYSTKENIIERATNKQAA